MSGTNLAGISSAAHVESAAPTATRAGHGSTNGTALDDVDRQSARRDADRPCAGLPSSVLHELRTPLTSIHGYAQVLQRSLRDNPRAANALGVVLRETTRLSGMLASLSEMAELQSGEVMATAIEVDVHQLVDGVVQDLVRRDGGAHPIEIQGQAVARCNPSLLAQAVLHVLTNATRFSPAGTPVSVDIAKAGKMVEIGVGDQGIGIEPVDAQRIYEPFERGTNAKQVGGRGLGLGLFLAQQALAKMCGRIEHRPRDGGGTVFRMMVADA